MARVVFQPQTRDALKSGIDTLAGAVAPTLGPLTGPVALDDATRGGSPELLDDAGTIARRILQLSDQDADIGAMLLRETLWQQTAELGDGAATAAVLYQSVFNGGHRFITAGGNAMLLRGQLEDGMKVMLEELRRQTSMIPDPESIERLAMSICGDHDIAAALADIFDVLGPHSPIEIRDGGRDLGHEFFLGSYWDSSVPSNIVFDGHVGERIDLRDTAWLISDFELDDLQALVKLVTDAVTAGFSSLAIVAKSFSEQIVAAQGANSQMQDFRLVYLQPTGMVDEQEAALDDLALITGGQLLRSLTGHRLDGISADMLGKSELAWFDRNRFGVMAGAGDEAIIKSEIDMLERRYQRSSDERQQIVSRLRIGRLHGGSAVVYCAGSSESEMSYQREVITRTVAAVRSALLGGTLPGGGTALLRCIKPLGEALNMSDEIHERAAYQILIEAAAAPCKTLLINAGHESAGVVVNDLLRCKNGAGYDLQSGSIVDLQCEGVIDSAAATMAAVRNGIGGAALALTVDTIVHRVNPPLAIEPGGVSSSADLGNIELR